jgi:phospholipid/cholesterol/gamma-HCH transport system permease protein
MFLNKEVLKREGAFKEFTHVVLLQIFYTYVQSIKLLLITGIIIGLAIAFQAQIGLFFLGKMDTLGQILNTILFRELTPLFITILIIIRSITAITSELATMKVTREIEALQIMGISINEYLIYPRVVAGSISFFCMATTFFLIALFGFWLGLNINSYVPFSSILHFFTNTITPMHIIFFVLKTVLLGGFIVHRACKHGLSLKKASFEIPIVTNQSVVDCLIFGIGLQVFLSAVAYFVFQVGI